MLCCCYFCFLFFFSLAGEEVSFVDFKPYFAKAPLNIQYLTERCVHVM